MHRLVPGRVVRENSLAEVLSALAMPLSSQCAKLRKLFLNIKIMFRVSNGQVVTAQNLGAPELDNALTQVGATAYCPPQKKIVSARIPDRADPRAPAKSLRHALISMDSLHDEGGQLISGERLRFPGPQRQPASVAAELCQAAQANVPSLRL